MFMNKMLLYIYIIFIYIIYNIIIKSMPNNFIPEWLYMKLLVKYHIQAFNMIYEVKTKLTKSVKLIQKRNTLLPLMIVIYFFIIIFFMYS